MKSKKVLSILLSGAFILSISIFSSCGGGKKGYSPSKSKVKSGSGMGHQKHKNKHVWGK